MSSFLKCVVTVLVYELWRVSAQTSPNIKLSLENPQDFPSRHIPSHSLYTVLPHVFFTFLKSYKLLFLSVLNPHFRNNENWLKNHHHYLL